jgi:hypothetical protein
VRDGERGQRTSTVASSKADTSILPLGLGVVHRLPPDPSFLLTVSIISKRWWRLIRGPAFLHRFRIPSNTSHSWLLLELLDVELPPGRRAHFVPTTVQAARISMPLGFYGWVIECYHARVLLYNQGRIHA